MNLDAFEPANATEIALLWEIRRLKKELHILGKYPNPYPSFAVTLTSLEAPCVKLTPTMAIEGNLMPDGRIAVRAEVSFKEAPHKFGYKEYTDSIYRNRFEASTALSHMHKIFMQKLAAELMKDVGAG